MAPAELRPRALAWATDIDVLPLDHVVTQRDGYLLVRSPSNPRHYWGNLLIFPEPPQDGDGERWERLFADAFADEPRVAHRTFAWDRTDGAIGSAQTEFVPRGYALERTVGMVAEPDKIREHPRANRDVTVLALDPRGDEDLWAGVREAQIAEGHPGSAPDAHRAFVESRQADLRDVFAAGRGTWYVATLEGRQVVGSLGIVVTDGRARYQHVDTVKAFRRRGICSRLVVDAAHHAVEHFGAEHFVIGADPDYHAVLIYESVGFERRENVAGVYRPPRVGAAGRG